MHNKGLLIKASFCRHAFSDLIQGGFGMRNKGKEIIQLIAGVFITVGAVRNGLFPSAFPDVADVTVVEKAPPIR